MNIIFCSIFFLPMETFSQEEHKSCMEQKISFDIGEELKYKIYYNWKAVWMGAGTVKFKTELKEIDGKAVFHNKAEGKTFRRYEWFYKVHDVYETFLDTSSLKPVRFIRDINEGGYTKHLQYDFEHENQQAYIDHFLRRGETKMEPQYKSISPCTVDLLSAVYYTRNIDYSQLQIKDTIPVNVLMDGEMYSLFLIFEGRENLKTDFGTFRCIKLRPSLMDGYIFEEGDFMTIWATDDDNRLPLFIESPLKVGSVKAFLQDFENLKYPLDSKVD